MKKMYYLYHIPGKKIGVTCNLQNRVEKIQGYGIGEYDILYKTDNIDKISEKEIQYQKLLGYKVDTTLYKDLNPVNMKINVTDQTTTFPVSKKQLKEYLGEYLGMGYCWQTSLGEFEITDDSIKWIVKNAKTSQFSSDRSFIYNKAFNEYFTSDNLFNQFTVYDNIRTWADKRGIYESGDPKTQYIKLIEESGELAQGILKQNDDEIKDAIGDMVVVLTNLAHLCGMKLEDCVDSAYNEIANRKGKMQNGTFVKQQ